MATAAERSFSPHVGRTLERFSAGLGRASLALVRVLESRRAVRDLAAFDDRMLADVGLRRTDLRDAMAVSAWRDATALLVERRRERRPSGRGPGGFLPELADAPPLAPDGVSPATGAEAREAVRRTAGARSARP